MSEKDKLIYNSAIQILTAIIAKEGAYQEDNLHYMRRKQIETAKKYAEELYKYFPNSN